MQDRNKTVCVYCRDPDIENSGRYTCNVVNDVGAAMASSHLTVFNNLSSSHSYRVSPKS